MTPHCHRSPRWPQDRDRCRHPRVSALGFTTTIIVGWDRKSNWFLTNWPKPLPSNNYITPCRGYHTSFVIDFVFYTAACSEIHIYHYLLCFFNRFTPVTSLTSSGGRHRSVDSLWVRDRISDRISSIHGEKHNTVGHPPCCNNHVHHHGRVLLVPLKNRFRRNHTRCPYGHPSPHSPWSQDPRAWWSSPGLISMAQVPLKIAHPGNNIVRRDLLLTGVNASLSCCKKFT